nr:SAVED domain-containing protein [Leifsonia sp. Leaf325]
MEERNTEVKRAKIPAPVRERIWGRAAARCVLCSKWLVDERGYWHSLPIGQIAHNVAAESGPKAPRGNSSLTAPERAAEENLLLLCPDCHRRIDSPQYRDLYSIEFLSKKKAQHERRVREVTDFATLRPAMVIRLTAPVRGTTSAATPAQVGEALRRTGLTGMGADTRTGTFDINITVEEESAWVWDASAREVDRIVARAQEAVAAQDAGVLAVFALAPIPTLVHFGAALDDKTETHLFRRARGDDVDVWGWAIEDVDTRTFESTIPDHEDQDEDATDIVALIDVSAVVSTSRIPTELTGMPLVRLTVAGGTSPDAITTRNDLDAFAAAWRDLLAKVETRWPAARRIHVIAAVPATAAITLGRHRMRDAHPTFVTYQRNADGEYKRALEVAG